MCRVILILIVLAWAMGFCSGCAAINAVQDYETKLLGSRCERIGYTPDTDPWRDCITSLLAASNASQPHYQSALCGTGANTYACIIRSQ